MAFKALALPYLFNFVSLPFPRQILLIKAEMSRANFDPKLAFCLKSLSFSVLFMPIQIFFFFL